MFRERWRRAAHAVSGNRRIQAVRARFGDRRVQAVRALFRDRRGQAVSAVLLVVAGAGFMVQLIADRPVLGPIGLLLLGVPGFVISQSVRPVPLSWPEVALVTLGTTLVFTVLVGIASALSPKGLGSQTAAAIELVPLGLAAAALARSRRSKAPRAALRSQARPGSVLAAAVGLALAGAAFVLATRSAQTQQQQVSVIQFWTVASATGGDPLLGLRNATGAGLDCSVAVLRPERTEVHLPVGAVDNGQSWSGELPPRDASDTSRWQISLRCVAADGSAVQRRLFVDPAAS